MAVSPSLFLIPLSMPGWATRNDTISSYPNRLAIWRGVSLFYIRELDNGLTCTSSATVNSSAEVLDSHNGFHWSAHPGLEHSSVSNENAPIRCNQPAPPFQYIWNAFNKCHALSIHAMPSCCLCICTVTAALTFRNLNFGNPIIREFIRKPWEIVYTCEKISQKPICCHM